MRYGCSQSIEPYTSLAVLACSLCVSGPGSQWDANRWDRQLDHESGASTFSGAMGFDAAAVKVNDVLHDRQSQPKSTLPTVAGYVGLTETLENVGKEIGVNSNTVVDHRYPYARIA